MDKKKLKDRIKKGSTVACIAIVLHTIGYCAVYPGIFNIYSHELSNFDMHRGAYWVSLIIAVGLAITLVKLGLTLNWKTYKEET